MHPALRPILRFPLPAALLLAALALPVARAAEAEPVEELVEAEERLWPQHFG